MLTRWEPFRDMLRLRNAVDHVFEDFYSGDQSLFRPSDWPSNWGLALDVAESTDDFVIKASLPGIKADDIEITYTENTLTIKGEVKEDKDINESQYHMRERRHGTFSRSITLPSKVKTEDIEASYENGVLTVHMPKAEEVKPKRIAIKATSPKVIEGKISKK
jgi:HSP20 family protein